MSRLARDGTAESVSRDQIVRRERGQGNIRFPFSVEHKQDRKPYPVDPFCAICDDHTYIHRRMAAWRKEEVDAARHLQEKMEGTCLGKLLSHTEAA